MKKVLFPLLAVLILVLTACSASDDEQTSEKNAANNQQTEETNDIKRNPLSGDLQELTATADELPKFLDSKPEDLQLVYEVAAHATDVLEWIPCYCGCGEAAGHRNNLNCFVAETREDGSVIWDDHGTRCLVCLEIAVESVQMHIDGSSIQEIRKYIDTKYEKGYAPPTKTDMPA